MKRYIMPGHLLVQIIDVLNETPAKFSRPLLNQIDLLAEMEEEIEEKKIKDK